MLQLDSKSVTAGAATLDAGPGQYIAFAIYVSGTNQAAQAVTAAQLGTITGTMVGESWASVEFDDLQAVGQCLAGQIAANSTTGGAFDFVAIIPASVARDGNVFDVQGDDGMQIKLDLSGVTGTIVASGTVELYGIPGIGEQAYIPEIGSSTPSVSANQSQITTIKQRNITLLAIANQTNLSKINVKKDSENVADVSAAALQKISNAASALVNIAAESDFSTVSLLNLAPSGLLDEVTSQQIAVKVTAGSGGTCNPHLITFGRAYSVALLNRSRSNRGAKAVQKRALIASTQPQTLEVGKMKQLRTDLTS